MSAALLSDSNALPSDAAKVSPLIYKPGSASTKNAEAWIQRQILQYRFHDTTQGRVDLPRDWYCYCLQSLLENRPRGLTLAVPVFALLVAPRARGFHDVYYEGMRCEPCDATSLCTGGGRFACPAHSLTEFSHSDGSPSDVEDCVCVPGFNRTGDVCELAPPGAFYYREGLAQPSPQHKRTYQEGPSELQQCVCELGYFLLGGACQQCAPDSFNPVPNQTACQGCPAWSSHARLGSTVVTDCECDAGAYSVAANAGEVVCSLCAGETAKAGPGNGACATCANNTFSNGTGATACISCHAHSVAPGGSNPPFRADFL